MDKSWFKQLFHRPKAQSSETVPQKSDEGNAEVQFNRGLKFANNEDSPQNYPLALEWYLKAARQNHPLAQFNVGMMYSKGQGTLPNEVEARLWILKAANQGDAGAQHTMGIKNVRSSFSGTDMIESKIEAYKWLHLATAQGYRGSQAALNTLVFGMTMEQVSEGSSRAASFKAVEPSETQITL
jgi:TPR repeat protein